MKKLIVPIISALITVTTIININPIADKLTNIITNEPTIVIKPTNKYTKNKKYLFVENTKDFIPYSYKDLLNIYYSVIDNGWKQFTFYCPTEYQNCIDDATKISSDELILTHLNNYVHPLNSFTNIKTSINDNGEITLKIFYLYQKEEIDKIENLEEKNKELKTELTKVTVELEKRAIELHETRQKYGIELETKINSELADLEMPNAKFKVNIENTNFNKDGTDEIEFLITTNKGEDFKPLIKTASGGEMSRIMLAIKTVLSDVDEVPILIFDEIDTGISGKAGNAVGEKLKTISKNHQVIIVTHLASIAAKGDSNYYIYKEVEGDNTKTRIKNLNEQEVIEEIARIASGIVSEISLKHAMELRAAV